MTRPSAPAYDHLIHLASLARETSKIELVSLLSPVTFRHPAVYYKMGVTLDEVSNGRFTMGIGTGWLDEEFTLFDLPYPGPIHPVPDVGRVPRPISPRRYRRPPRVRRRALPAKTVRAPASCSKP